MKISHISINRAATEIPTVLCSYGLKDINSSNKFILSVYDIWNKSIYLKLFQNSAYNEIRFLYVLTPKFDHLLSVEVLLILHVYFLSRISYVAWHFYSAKAR